MFRFFNKFTLVIFLALLLSLVGLALNEAIESGGNKGYAPEQPIKYSHKLHAGELKIPCLYCHYAAEQGRHAGIPPSEVCLNCHKIVKPDSPEIKKIHASVESGKPIEWVKVHYYPDFAYFNHSQHVKVGKISCQECHGPVEKMTVLHQEKSLRMGWCLDCHRSKGIAPPEDHKSAAGGDCVRCHH